MRIIEIIRNIDLYSQIYSFVFQIPFGKVSTYSKIAELLGDKRYASRTVGFVLSKNKNFFQIPCHRVIMSNGNVGGFALGKEIKKYFLKLEGIEIQGDYVKNLEKYLFEDFRCKNCYTLKFLRKIQLKLSKKINLNDRINKIEKIGLFDVSYVEKNSREFGIGGLVIINQNGKILKEKTCIEEIKFPYIPTYLSYREYILINKCLENEDLDLLIIDGNGILHPIKMGIATFAGILENIPTIGIAKSLLTGKEIENYVYLNEERVAFVLRYKNKKYYISPGNFISLEKSIEISKRLFDMFKENPTNLAHRLVNREKRKLINKNLFYFANRRDNAKT